ncbi:hypothetical protein N3K66_002647 [Trichothecium roseum]|uniref:Uncharacterized protein n=1 Tax=Trichothecium roseum TaxID=47278 RepID=A0ACC0VA53_9HYPO|nr:hypothetical protein N3K66_002647 [Trichothecium roseum]
MKWDQQVHEDILIALFQHIKFGGAEISKIMEELRDKGYTFTESALRQHVQKLRKTRDSAAPKSDGVAPDGGAPVTPSKRTPGGKAKKAKAAAKMQDEEEADDDDDGADLGKVFPPEAKVKVSTSEGEDEFPPEVLPPTKKGRKSRASQRKAEVSLAEAAEGEI